MNRRTSALTPDWVKHAQPIEGVERFEAWFRGNAYSMHRHDTYAIGRTLAGVQSFSYRRGQRNSLPGNTMVLHPDEPHDGQAGTDEGFRYRMIYVHPSLFQDVLGGQALPFVEGGVTTDPRLAAATETLLQHVSHTLEPLEQSDALTELAHALAAVSGAPARKTKGDYQAARRARDFLHTHSARVVTLEELEAATGRDRWSLSRDFRTFYGTSPYRYLTMRRLDDVRHQLLVGISLVDAASTAGFADQSHMTRHFSKTFGLTPGRWLQVASGILPG
ncbi:AraC family transcriptional regulator [Pandoraea oxalativorans]|uniref:AraC family transcriptional regulator n=1 Tax=Pandoraea oxalativorans TaxID=573737 RepID=A0A0E3YCV7_9BURK|nr:AraC family transcriptional regulator [Pandoraea oxalativorans]AKC69982.1 AraC family transcriptional regulator [Pandoraea oxalativorans]